MKKEGAGGSSIPACARDGRDIKSECVARGLPAGPKAEGTFNAPLMFKTAQGGG